jgi:hypothetical protein
MKPIQEQIEINYTVKETLHHPRLITITPQTAVEMLNQNQNNRPISETQVSHLTRAIKEGDWKVNGDMVRISKTGKVIDGQHRLLAVIRSKMAIDSWMIEGLDDDVFDTIDIGKKRSVADTLSCRGEKNTTSLASALKLTARYFAGKVEASMVFSTTDIEKELEKHPEMRDCIFSSSILKGLISPSVLNTCNYLFQKKCKTLARLFFERLISGEDLKKGDPVHALRERLVQNAGSKAKLKDAHVFALSIKAFNYFCLGTKATHLKLMEQDGRMIVFPKVID